MHIRKLNSANGFTIVELLIVVVVIAILAAITLVAFNGITGQARETTLKSDLRNAAAQLIIAKQETGTFPGDSNALNKSNGTVYQYTGTGDTFCLTASATQSNKTFNVTHDGAIQEGLCVGHVTSPIQSGAPMQTVTAANCSTARTMVVDARDNRSYWVQKLADGKCWMLTNLAYAGGGTNTYSDVKTLQNGTADAAGTYTAAKYYVHASANPTSGATAPSASTDGGATGAQYGYLYNWCAAMGVQTTTSACANATTPAFNANTSICPANWRIPTSTVTTGETTVLNNTVNGGSSTSDAGLRTAWLGQRAGYWSNGAFTSQGSSGFYWSSRQSNAVSAVFLYIDAASVGPIAATGKLAGHSVRCILQ